MAIKEFKILDRLKYRFDHILTLTIAPEPDEVCDRLTSNNPLATKVYLDNKRDAYVQSLQQVAPERMKRKLEMDLSVLDSLWRDAKTCYEYQHTDSHKKDDLYILSEFYYAECLNYIAIAWYMLLTECEEVNTDISKYVKGLTHELISVAVEKMELCSRDEYLSLVGKGIPAMQAQQANSTPSSMPPQVTAVREKQGGSAYLFESPQAQVIYEALVKAKLIACRDGINYTWLSTSKAGYAYVCYKLSSKLLGDDSQIESRLFGQKISSSFDIKTIARYARAYKENKKTIDAKLKKKIDDCF